MFTLVVCNKIDVFDLSRPLHLGPEFSDNMVTCRIVVVLTRLPYLALGILVIGCKIKISYFPAGRLVENAPGVDGCLTDDALLHPPPHLGGHLPPPTPSPSHWSSSAPPSSAPPDPPSPSLPHQHARCCQTWCAERIFSLNIFFEPVLRAWSPMQVNVGFHSQLIEPDKQPFEVVESSRGVGVVQDWLGKGLPRLNLSGAITNCQVH